MISAPVQANLIVDAAAAFQPGYAVDFRCIGPACEDSCCQGWDVRLDEATYTKYLSMPPGPLPDRIRQSLVLITDGQTPRNYAGIRLDAGRACPFLDTDRLCEIQKGYGPEYLSSVCAQYPRSRQTIEGEMEETLLPSCPEAARMVLLHPRLLPEGVSGSYQEFQERAEALPATGKSLMAYFWTIRRFALMLLVDRSYELWERIFLLGTLAMRLEAIAGQGQWGQTPKVLRDYAGLAAAGSLRPAMAGVQKQPLLQLSTILSLLMERLRMGRPSSRFLDCLQAFTDGIGYTDGARTESLVPAYRHAFSTAYLPWREENQSVLENYLVNAALIRLFPLGPGGPEQGLQPGREALRLAIHYGLIQGILIGAAGGSSSDFSTPDAIRIIQSFAKTFEHSHGYLDRFLDALERKGLKNAQGIAALAGDPA